MPRQAERISVFGTQLKGLGKKGARVNKEESMRQTISGLQNLPKIRTVKLNNFNYVDRVANSKNRLQRGRYNCKNFPSAIFNHLRLFMNMLYVAVCLIQFYKPLKMTFYSSFIVSPLLAIFVYSIREITSDLYRYYIDSKLN